MTTTDVELTAIWLMLVVLCSIADCNRKLLVDILKELRKGKP